MMVFAMLSWWYTAGWARLAKRVGTRVTATMEAFSVTLLASTLFSPFRQISAGAAQGKSLDVQLRAFGDRLFSRVFGAFVRSLFIVIGLIASLLAGLIGVVQLILWPLVPFGPIIGVALMVMKVQL
ncbi:MAG TPA: hypothetical protein VLI54_04235 [Bacillota bacterium]|nr:hypothetical protein [Bacillota bacterium]